VRHALDVRPELMLISSIFSVSADLGYPALILRDPLRRRRDHWRQRRLSDRA
jgi:hypothetical protein